MQGSRRPQRCTIFPEFCEQNSSGQVAVADVVGGKGAGEDTGVIPLEAVFRRWNILEAGPAIGVCLLWLFAARTAAFLMLRRRINSLMRD